ncbi:hypothetical protein [Ponticaulis koreensis]|uniref:hypothetical protein n=1 Tax=Ponticaulis koreensis TaxID=1123045 RepID=UPI0003B4444C|nr:hypothetical protein [Ponticaulis koreensis]
MTNAPDVSSALPLRTRALYLIICALGVMLVGYAFLPVAVHWEFVFLDTLIAPDDVRAALDTMTPGQKEVHIWASWLLDLPYPLFYWGLFGGLIVRGLPAKARILIWVPRVAFASDIVENTLQTFMLFGTDGLIYMKSAVTLLKFGLYALAALIALTALIALVWRGVRARGRG